MERNVQLAVSCEIDPAVTAESAIKRQYGLPAENIPVGAVLQVSEREVN
jgi:hypothetical protein